MTTKETGNLATFGFIIAAVSVLLYGFPYENIWTLASGSLLWLLAVANAKITELLSKKS